MSSTQMSNVQGPGSNTTGAEAKILKCFGSPTTAVNDVQTITVDACTNSTLTLTNLPGGRSITLAQDISTAAMATALTAAGIYGTSGVAVTGTYSGGSGGTYILTFGGGYAGMPVPVLGVSADFVGGSTPTVANVHTTPGVKAAFSGVATTGDLLVDGTNHTLFINSGTAAVPVWTQITIP